MSGQRNDNDKESRRILDRINAQTNMGRAHESDDPHDWPEYWGKRVGRALGMVFLLVVIYWLYELITKTG